MKKVLIWWFFFSLSVSCLLAGVPSKKGTDNVDLEEPGIPIIEEIAVVPELGVDLLDNVPYEIISNILENLHVGYAANFLKARNSARSERPEEHFKRSLGAIRDYQKFIVQPPANITIDEYRKQLIKDATAFVKGFSPNEGDITAPMCILSFKFMVPLGIARYSHTHSVEEKNLYILLNRGMDVYLKTKKYKLADLETLTGALKLTDHIYIIRFLLDKSKEIDMGAACFIYLRILQVSPKSVKKWLSVYATQKVKLLEDMANGYYALHELSATKPKPKDDNFEPKPHLNLPWKEFCKYPPSPESQQKLKSQNAKWHMEVLDKNFESCRNTSLGLQRFATIYCAASASEGENFGKSMNDARINFLLFDLEKKNPIINRLGSILKAKCKKDPNCKALETELEHQVNAMNELIGDKKHKATDKTLMALKFGMNRNVSTQESKDVCKVGDLLREECKNIDSESGMKKYIELVKKILTLGHISTNDSISNDSSLVHTMPWLFDGFFRIMHDCEFLQELLEKKLDLLKEAEKLHSHLTVQSSLSNKLNSFLASKLHEKFEYLLKPKRSDGRQIRDQQAIILKFALTYLAETTEILFETTVTSLEFVRRVSKCFYTLAAIDPESIANHNCIHQWNRFRNRILSLHTFHSIFSHATNANSGIGFVHRPLNGTANKSPVVYLAHWNILFAVSHLQISIDRLVDGAEFTPAERFLYVGLPYHEQLIRNMRESEKNIDKAMPIDSFIQEEYIKQRCYFHHFFMNRTRREQNIDLTEFVEMEIGVIYDTLLSDTYEAAYPYLRLGILYNIFVAITENADTAETLGGELIEKVDQLTLNLMCQYREYVIRNPYLQDQLIKYKAVVEPLLKKQSDERKLK